MDCPSVVKPSFKLHWQESSTSGSVLEQDLNVSTQETVVYTASWPPTGQGQAIIEFLGDQCRVEKKKKSSTVTAWLWEIDNRSEWTGAKGSLLQILINHKTEQGIFFYSKAEYTNTGTVSKTHFKDDQKRRMHHVRTFWRPVLTTHIHTRTCKLKKQCPCCYDDIWGIDVGKASLGICSFSVLIWDAIYNKVWREKTL